jgi:hypothetical protein
MTLPDLASQLVYGRLAWAVVTAAALFALLPLSRFAPLSRRASAALLAGIAVLFALPGQASPAWWLTLAFQYPSGLLFGCCMLKLRQHWDGPDAAPVMTPPLAAALAVTGLVLYLDAMGLLTQGYYYAGFGPTAAPLLAVLGAIGCAVALVQGHARAQAGALLTTILLSATAPACRSRRHRSRWPALPPNCSRCPRWARSARRQWNILRLSRSN